MNKNIYPSENSGQVITIFALLVICFIAFIPLNSLTSPVLASDDWSLIVAPYAFGELRPIDILNHRPFDRSIYYILTSIFGLKFEYYYLLNAVVIFLAAVLIYLLVKRMFPQHVLLASLAALVYIIYPVDYTRTWLIMLYIRFWWLISLVAIWLMLDFLDTGNKWKIALSFFSIIISLGAYEGQFGIVLTATLLISLLSQKKFVRRRAVLLGSIVFISLFFYIWRFHIQANIPNIKYYSAESFQFNPIIIAGRYLQGFDIFLKRWLVPIKAQLGISASGILIWSILYSALCYFGILYFCRKYTSTPKLTTRQKLPELKSQFILLLVGAVFWFAGYIPIIGLYRPLLNGHASRVNMFAVAGAAVIVVSLVALFSTFLTQSTFQARFFAVSLILPFILIGVFVQLQINKETQMAWNTQRNIWNGVLRTVPNIRDERNIVVIIPAYERLRPFESYPFTTAWEINAESQVMYNNPTVGGIYYYKDLQNQDFKFTKNGIIPPGTERLIGYKRLIFVLYNSKDSSVELVNNIEETLALPFEIDNYTPNENIVPEEPTTTRFQWLMQ